MNLYQSARVLSLCLLFLSPADAFMPLAHPRPKILASKAIETATSLAKKEIDLDDYYIDRAWLGSAEGYSGLVWIVSFSHDGKDGDTGPGWYIVVVDQEGKATKFTGSHKGSPPSFLEFKAPDGEEKK